MQENDRKTTSIFKLVDKVKYASHRRNKIVFKDNKVKYALHKNNKIAFKQLIQYLDQEIENESINPFITDKDGTTFVSKLVSLLDTELSSENRLPITFQNKLFQYIKKAVENESFDTYIKDENRVFFVDILVNLYWDFLSAASCSFHVPGIRSMVDEMETIIPEIPQLVETIIQNKSTIPFILENAVENDL